MLELSLPINNTKSYNNFSMKEKIPTKKINLRGNPNNKDFSAEVGKLIGVILPIEVGSVIFKEELTVITLGPNEWLIFSNNNIKNNEQLLGSTLYESISKKLRCCN